MVNTPDFESQHITIKTWKDNTLPLSCGRQITLSKVDKICPSAIPNQISTISMHISGLVKIHWQLLKLSSRKKNSDMLRADNAVKNWWNLPISNLKPGLHNINAHTKFGENPLITRYRLETKIRMCSRLITLSTNWRNWPINNPKPDLHNINAHTKFGENPMISTQVIIWKWK